MYSLILMMAMGTGSDAVAFGRHGCNGGCRGGHYAGCHGSYRGCNGGRYSSGCHGCCRSGYVGCHGGCAGSPYAKPPGRPAEKVPAPKPAKPGTEEAYLPARATLRVSLPATARLTVDGTPTTSTSSTRLFLSPELPRDKTFHYTMNATFVRNGRELTSTKKVAVRAAEETRVTMDFPLLEVARK